jgi:hypothetical protein
LVGLPHLLTKGAISRNGVMADWFRQLRQLSQGDESPEALRSRLRDAGTVIKRITEELLPQGVPFDELRHRLTTAQSQKPYEQPLISLVIEAVIWARDKYPAESRFLDRKYSHHLCQHEVKSGRDAEFVRHNLPVLAELLQRLASTSAEVGRIVRSESHDDSAGTNTREKVGVRPPVGSFDDEDAALPDDSAGTNTRDKILAEPEPSYAFVRAGASFKIVFQGESGFIPFDLLGSRYAFCLVQHPQKSTEAVVLRHRAAVMANDTTEFTNADLAGEVTPESVWQNTSSTDRWDNRKALREIRKELQEINSGLAGGSLSEQEIVAYQHDKKELEKEIRRLSLHRKPRSTAPGDPNEAARTSVRGALRTLYKNCRERWRLVQFADHLKDAIKTEGTSYAYRPKSPIDWFF